VDLSDMEDGDDGVPEEAVAADALVRGHISE
jgi:hypothetical protein